MANHNASDPTVKLEGSSKPTGQPLHFESATPNPRTDIPPPTRSTAV